MLWTSAEVQRDYHAFGHDARLRWATHAASPGKRWPTDSSNAMEKSLSPSLAHGQSVPLHPALPALLAAFQQGLTPAFTGQQSVAEASNAVAQEQDNILALWAP